MADYNKDTKKRIADINAEKDLQTNLSSILQTNLDLRTKQGKIGKNILASMTAQKGAEAKLIVLMQEKQKVLEAAKEFGKERTEQLIEMIQHQEKLLETEAKREKLNEGIRDAGKDLAKDLGSALGVSNEMVTAIMTLSAAAIGLAIFKEIASFIGDAVKRMKDLSKETGASAAQAMELEGSIKGAQLSLNPFLYSFEEVAESAKALRDATGQINPPASLLADITEVNALLSDPKAATSLTRTLQNAGIDAGDLANEVKEIGQSLGQDAGPAMEYFADNQALVRTLTKDQLKQRATEVIQLKKMGIDMKKMKDLASESLDIEKSMKDEMKLRMMTGKNISFAGIRQAQVSGDALAMAKEQKALIDSVGPSLGSNLQLQRQISEATGLSVDEMMSMQNATAEAVNSGKELDAGPSDALGTLGTVVTVLAAIAAGGLVVYGILLLMGKLPTPKFLQSKKGSNPIASFIGKFGSSDVLKGAAAMLLVAASMFVMAMAISKMPTDPAPYLGMAVGLGLMLGALYLLAKFPTADLLKGALALAVVGVSLIPFAYAMNLIGDISIGAILAVAAGILIFTGIILGLGMIMFSGVGALIFGAGVLALLALGAAMIVLGAGIVIFNKGVSGLGDNISIFVESISELLNIAPMLLGAVIPLVAFGLAMIPFGFGLLMASPGILLFGLALTTVAAAMNLFGVGIETFSKGISGIGEGIGIFAEKLSSFVLIAPSLLAASIALAAFGLSMIPLGIGLLFATPGVLLFGLALTTVALAMNLFGVGIDKFSSGISGIGDSIGTFTEKLKDLVSLAPMLLVSATSLGIFGLSLIPFGIGLLFATPPMLMFGLAMIPFAAGINLLNGLLPTFVDNITKLVEQSPNLIAISSAFMMFSGALITTTAAMIPFFPTFSLTTLGMLALVPAMLLSSVATTTWSLSLTSLSNSIERLMPNLTAFLGVMPMMSAMIMLVPGLIALSASFIMLSASLVALSGGLAIVTLLLPTLFALAFALPLITAAFGGGDSGGDGGGESSSMSEVVDEIKGLRQDIQNQPIMINVDGKVVSEITKVQSRKLSTRSAGYFGG